MRENSNMYNTVLSKVEQVLNKPRTSAHTPAALVEVVYALLGLVFDDRKFEKFFTKEFGGTSRAWWLNEDLDYPMAVTRLVKLTEYLKDNN